MAHQCELVACAGFMRIMTGDFISKWSGRMINIHPSLLPLFKGIDTHERALEAGVRVHGCTVHFVSEELDAGAIIAQGVVPVHPGDDADTLAARVLTVEHRLYPAVLDVLAQERISMGNGRTVFADDGRQLACRCTASTDRCVKRSSIEWRSMNRHCGQHCQAGRICHVTHSAGIRPRLRPA
jgi:methionyl-tRNA formyltransferase